LAARELELLLQRVRSTAASTEEEVNPRPRALGDRTEAPSRGALYRPCPVCSKLMHRRNFGRKSGVIVDQCRPHGFWFDVTELETVLQWVRTGGEIEVERLEKEEERVRRSRLEMERRFTPVVAEGSRGYRGTRTFVDLLTWLATVIR
jgi:Zn-finger nucleic acid-binding protein